MASEYEIGEFNEDGALDELYYVIRLLAERIDTAMSHAQFCGVDISGVRANIAILATLIGQHGSGHLIKRAQVKTWAQKIDELFTNGSMWGFTPWPEEVKAEWRMGCRHTVQKLLDVLEDC